MFASRRPARSRERTILRLTVEAAERIHPQEHVVYCVVAVCTDGVRRRWRRYSQFHAFHAQLPEARRLPFPSKKWRQQLGFNAVERRRVKLNAFLTELLDTPLAFKSRAQLRSFLGLPPPPPPPAPQPQFFARGTDDGCGAPVQRRHYNSTEVGCTTSWATTSRAVTARERIRSRAVRSVGPEDGRIRGCDSFDRLRGNDDTRKPCASAKVADTHFDSELGACDGGGGGGGGGDDMRGKNRSQGLRRSCSAMALRREDFSRASLRSSRHERRNMSRAQSVDRELAGCSAQQPEAQGRPKVSALARGRRRGGAGGGFGEVDPSGADSLARTATHSPCSSSRALYSREDDVGGDLETEWGGSEGEGGDGGKGEGGGNLLAEMCMVDELASAQADARSMQARAALLSEYAAGNISADEWRIFDAVEERNHDARRRRRRARSVAGGGVGSIAGIGGSSGDGGGGFVGMGGNSGGRISVGIVAQPLDRNTFGGARAGGANICGNTGRSHSVASASSGSIRLDAPGMSMAMDEDDDATMEVDLHCTGGLMWPLLPGGAPAPTLPPSSASLLAMGTLTPITVPVAVRANDGRPVPSSDKGRSVSMDVATLRHGTLHAADSGGDVDRMAEVIVGSLGRGCGGGALRIPADEVVCNSTANGPKPGNDLAGGSEGGADGGVADLETMPQPLAACKRDHHVVPAVAPAPEPETETEIEAVPAPTLAPAPARVRAPTTNYDALMAARLRKRRADARAEGTLRARTPTLMPSIAHQSCSSDLTADTRDWLLDQLAKRGEITETERQHIQDKCDAHALQLQAELDKFYLGAETAAAGNGVVNTLSQRSGGMARNDEGDQAAIERGPTYLVVGGENGVAKGAQGAPPTPRSRTTGKRSVSPQLLTPPSRRSAASPRMSPGVSPELWRPSCWPEGGKNAPNTARLDFPSALREHNLQRRRVTVARTQWTPGVAVAAAQL